MVKYFKKNYDLIFNLILRISRKKTKFTFSTFYFDSIVKKIKIKFFAKHNRLLLHIQLLKKIDLIFAKYNHFYSNKKTFKITFLSCVIKQPVENFLAASRTTQRLICLQTRVKCEVSTHRDPLQQIYCYFTALSPKSFFAASLTVSSINFSPKF